MNEITPDSLMIVGGRGRPTRAGARSDRAVKFFVTADEHEALKSMAAAQRQPMAAVIREAVNEYVADYGERSVFRRVPFE